MQHVVLGWVVKVGPWDSAAKEKPKVASKRFTVESAAQTFAELLRKGTPDKRVWVESVHGLDDAGIS